ncbi:hypothetical protein MBANPS3_012137 [Mucor bainieri]
MQPKTRRAVIRIPRVIDAEISRANPLPNAGLADSSFSDDLDIDMSIERGPKSPKDNSTPLPREQSTGNSDTKESDAPMEYIQIPENSMACALKQTQIEQYYKNSNNTNKKETRLQQDKHMSSEESSRDKTEELLMNREKQAIIVNADFITEQANDDKDDNDNVGSNANNSGLAVAQDKDGADESDDNMMDSRFMPELGEIKVEEMEPTVDRKVLEQAPPATDVGDDQGPIFKCAKCPHRTIDFASLMKHRQKYHRGRPYAGTSIKHLHLSPILSDPNNYCRACERKFPTPKNYRNHLQLVHHIIEPTARENLAFGFGNGSNDINESSATDDPQGAEFQCGSCDERFSSMLRLTRHQINDHDKQNDGKDGHCADCDTHYTSSQEALQHKCLVRSAEAQKTASAGDTIMNKTAGSSITCKTCGMAFASTKAHLVHFNDVHRYNSKSNNQGQLSGRQKPKVKTVRFLLPDSAPSSTTATIFRCKSCDIACSSRANLTRHHWAEHRHIWDAARDSNGNSLQHTSTDPYRCRSCLEQCESRSALMQHLSVVHNNFDYSSPRKIIEPPSEASFRCSSCPVACDSRSALVVHMWGAHPGRMRGSRKKEPVRKPKEEIQPVDMGIMMQDDQSHHCELCDKSFKTLRSYRSHMNTRHSNGSTDNPRSITDNTPNANRPKKSASVANPLLPDINDPNFYCRVCDKTLRTKYSYYSHLLVEHSDFSPDQSSQHQQKATIPKKRQAVLDVDDPNNHCAFCNRTFESQDTFHQHLRSKHYIKQRLNTSSAIPSTATTTTTTTNIATTSPTSQAALSSSKGKHLCTICQQRQATLGHHRQHLRLAHKVKLPPVSKEVTQFRYPDEFIDVNSPDLYCAQCDHYFTTKMFFKKHVEGVHEMSSV